MKKSAYERRKNLKNQINQKNLKNLKMKQKRRKDLTRIFDYEITEAYYRIYNLLQDPDINAEAKIDFENTLIPYFEDEPIKLELIKDIKNDVKELLLNDDPTFRNHIMTKYNKMSNNDSFAYTVEATEEVGLILKEFFQAQFDCITENNIDITSKISYENIEKIMKCLIDTFGNILEQEFLHSGEKISQKKKNDIITACELLITHNKKKYIHLACLDIVYEYIIVLLKKNDLQKK